MIISLAPTNCALKCLFLYYKYYKKESKSIPHLYCPLLNIKYEKIQIIYSNLPQKSNNNLKIIQTKQHSNPATP